jgi:hypothetical protein
MAIRNRLNDDDSRPREIIQGHKLTNKRTQRVVRVPGPDGNVQEIVVASHESVPDQDGFVDTEIVNLTTDSSGRILPEDAHSMIAFSNTGAYILSSEEFARCTSFFHPAGVSTNILVGHDGVLVPGGARCSRCQRIYNRILLGLAGVGIIFFLALYKAAGLY